MTVEEAPTETPKAAAGDWFQSAVVYQIYPRSFADSNGDGIGDLRGIIGRLDYLAAAGRRRRLALPDLHLAAGRQRLRHQRLPRRRPALRDPRGAPRTDRRAARARHEAGDGPGGQPHLGRAPLVRGIPVLARTTRSATGTGGGRRGRRRRARRAAPAAEPNNWGSAFSGPAWEFDQATGEYYLHLFSKKQPDLNWENPEVRAAVYEMMNWWLDRAWTASGWTSSTSSPRTPSLPDGPVADGKLFGDGSPFYIAARACTSSCRRCTGKSSPDRTGELLTVGEMPGVTVDDAVLYTDPARAEVDMVFQFEHVALDQEDGDKWRPKKLLLTELKQTLGRWQDGLAETRLEQPVLGQPRPGPRRVPLRRRQPAYRELSAKMLAGILHLHRGTPYVYQGEELGMTNMTLRRDQRLPRHRGPQPPPRSHHPPGPHRRRGPRRPRAAEPGQRPDPGPVGRLPACRLHHRGTLDRGEPERQPHQRRRPGG